ncbi:uncharacterized protein UTRI_01056 [Ustilago trichophora]|uniref:Uncharacterized protein n=1 Tax=Ustilago trichophora TaxID=86804 RepID=A0A5C3DVU1_9BASI|nr:uncharacterized protein UTRI_01056 [Ustilago trichophora]
MFSNKLSIFAALTVALFPGLAMAEWLPDGPAQWANLCSLQAEASGEFVCFTYPTDITAAGATGNYQGYADNDGKSFALIPKGSGVGEYSTMNTADRQVTINAKCGRVSPSSPDRNHEEKENIIIYLPNSGRVACELPAVAVRGTDGRASRESGAKRVRDLA